MNAYTWPEEDTRVSGSSKPEGKASWGIQGIIQAGKGLLKKEPPTEEDPKEKSTKLSKTQRQSFLVKEIKKRVDKYFEIAINQVADFAPKLITNFLINDIIVS